MPPSNMLEMWSSKRQAHKEGIGMVAKDLQTSSAIVGSTATRVEFGKKRSRPPSAIYATLSLTTASTI